MFIVRLSVVTLLLFLIILIARYFTLLWFAYLHHLESSEKKRSVGVEYPPVSILVPAYNEGKVIIAAVQSLLEMDYPHYEVIVVDDGSTDDTLANAMSLAGAYGSCEVRVTTKRNGGKASSLNAGLAMARYPFVLCMDADSRLEPQTIRASMVHFSDPSVGAVAGNVKVINRRNIWTRLQALEYIEGLNMARRAQGFLNSVNIVPGPIGLFRRDVLIAVNGYDLDTFAEDADLTLKILTAGWRIKYEPRAVAWTEAPERVVDLIQQRYRWTRGILQAMGKHRRTLLMPLPDVPLWLSLLQMGFEAMLWPMMNVYGHLFFAYVALAFGMSEVLLAWWAVLTLLDLVAALATVGMEEEQLSLVPYAIIYRFFFILLIDVVKLCSTMEEALNLRMTWGKLERVGRI
ncbi:MAG: glycosyltransferase family 2 protein [Gemmatimonadota bacterium]|nr:MAG: glycosyltransferase family 2 protein [Gemmatimonadota bacterium]